MNLLWVAILSQTGSGPKLNPFLHKETEERLPTASLGGLFL